MSQLAKLKGGVPGWAGLASQKPAAMQWSSRTWARPPPLGLLLLSASSLSLVAISVDTTLRTAFRPGFCEVGRAAKAARRLLWVPGRAPWSSSGGLIASEGVAPVRYSAATYLRK